jgi:hypothetical protein
MLPQYLPWLMFVLACTGLFDEAKRAAQDGINAEI